MDELVQAWGSDHSAHGTSLFYRSEQGYRVRVVGVGEFVLSQGGFLSNSVRETNSDAIFRSVYERQIVPLLLSLRGHRVFHGGAVCIGDVAIALLGPSGAGKSTLTAALARHGYPFLTDDCLLLSDEDSPQVIPDAASIRVWPDSVAALAPDPSLVHETEDKPRIFADADWLPHRSSPVPLVAGFLLSDSGDSLETSSFRLSPADTAMAWLSNMYSVDPRSAKIIRGNIGRAAKLAEIVPTFSLSYPREFSRLGDVVHHVLARAAQLQSYGEPSSDPNTERLRRADMEPRPTSTHACASSSPPSLRTPICSCGSRPRRRSQV